MNKWARSALIAFAAILLPRLVNADVAAVKLVDFRGRPVAFSAVQRDATLVAFWSAACVPCIEEMPLLEALYKKLSDREHLTVIGVNLDEDSDLPAARKILEERKPTYPMLRDPRQELVKQWFPEHPEQLPLPTLLVLDRQFHALFSQGFTPGTTAESFIAAWSPRLADARAGKLHEHLQRIAAPKGGPTDPAQMALFLEKLIRSHHPELSDADVKVRVDAALKEFKSKGTFSIE